MTWHAEPGRELQRLVDVGLGGFAVAQPQVGAGAPLEDLDPEAVGAATEAERDAEQGRRVAGLPGLEPVRAEPVEDVRALGVLEVLVLRERAGALEQLLASVELAKGHACPRLGEQRPEGEPRGGGDRDDHVLEEVEGRRLVAQLDGVLGGRHALLEPDGKRAHSAAGRREVRSVRKADGATAPASSRGACGRYALWRDGQ